MNFFEIKNTAFEIFSYPLSYVELIGTTCGVLSVYFASRQQILTWPAGIINVSFLFMLFFQVQLYPDMFLQVYFLIANVYGWYQWREKKENGEITILNVKQRFISILLIVLFTLVAGCFFTNIHLYLPIIFNIPSAYPFVDSFIMVLSIAAMWLLAKKKLENWHLWILIDVVSVCLYVRKGIYFLALEYFIFLVLAVYGLYEWRRQVVTRVCRNI